MNRPAQRRNGRLVNVKPTPTSSSIEDYVKVIYSYTEWQDKPITSTALALRLGVANSSVSEMVRKLKDQGLVDHQPYSAIRLTASGLALALAMVRRHRLLETFLVQELGYSWDEVHDEAERLEHAVSETYIERMSAKLGHPVRDPHGDPIPDARGRISMPLAYPLGQLDAGHRARIVRISDHDPELLRYLQDQRMGVDSALRVLGRKPFGGPLGIELLPTDPATAGPRLLDLSDEVVAALWVATEGTHEGCTVSGPASGTLMSVRTGPAAPSY